MFPEQGKGILTPVSLPLVVQDDDQMEEITIPATVGFPREGFGNFVDVVDNDDDDNDSLTVPNNNMNNSNNNNNDFTNYSPYLFACSLISNVELDSINKTIDQSNNNPHHFPYHIF